MQSVLMLLAQVMRRCQLRLRARRALAAEHLFLQKQVALYQAHNATWRCDMHATRFTLVWLSQWFDWQPALTIVHPATFKRWRRQGWRLLLTKPAKPGRPPIPLALQALIRRMARENVTWGQQRIANELLLKLGLRVSPRTVRKYMPRDCGGGPGPRCPSQRWSTFIRNHAQGLIVSGLGAVLTRSVQAWSGRISGLVLWWWSRFTASKVHGRAQTDTVSLSLLRETGSVSPAWSPDTEEVIHVDKRSPPAMGPPRIPDPCPAAPAALVDTFAVCPAAATLCWRSGIGPHSWAAEPRSTGETQGIPWRQVA